MIGVVIPAHNEEASLHACLAAMQVAARHPSLGGEEVRVLVALDCCSDRSAAIVRTYGADSIELNARNVGMARAAGSSVLLEDGARWLAFTDADTVVSPAWLAAQISLSADAVCGTVTVADWTPHGDKAAHMRQHFADTYTDRDGHRHIHGANLGVSADAYSQAGGFQPLVSSEDVALVKALIERGARIAWSALPRVTTSSRVNARAPAGFGETLARIAREVLPAT